MAISTQPTSSALGEVARVFGRLGCTAFGGPVAHIAAMEDLLVRERAWVTRDEFLDLVSAANLIPGPNSTELAIHLGYRRAGWRGLIVAGLAFIAPATLMVWVLAMAYVRFGARPEVHGMLLGMQPVVLAVVVQAIWRLGRSALTTAWMIGVALVCAVALLAGAHELLVLALGSVAMVLRPVVAERGATRAFWPALFTVSSVPVAIATAPTAVGVFTSFVKIGSVLFGSGYVLLAFLRAEFVERLHWLTEGQLLDAIAVGQVTPGPVFTSATFVGFLLAGHGGALAATIGIFLPAFLFVAVSGPWVRQVRRSPRWTATLDGVNAASLALMCVVVLRMVPPVATSVAGVAIFLAASALLLRTTIGAGWMLLAGAMIGFARTVIFSAGVP